jgi:hypothetical protein
MIVMKFAALVKMPPPCRMSIRIVMPISKTNLSVISAIASNQRA